MTATGGLDDHRDRSSLAWQRTMAQAALVVLFAAVTSIRVGEPTVTIGAAALAVVAFGLAAGAPSAGRRKSAWPLMRTAAGITFVAGMLGAILPIALLLTA
jgi:hypothetical protein